MSERRDRDVQEADPKLRKRVLGVLAIAVLLAALGVRLLDLHLQRLQALAQSSPHEAAERALTSGRIFLAALLLGVTVLAAYLGRLSWRTLRAGRYPPPGRAVINDTPVLRGAEARRYGRLGLGLAALLLVASWLVVSALDRRLGELLDTTLRPTPVSPAELGLR